MKTSKKVLFLIVTTVLITSTGCETYKKTPFMPENVNYTHYFNDDGSPGQDAIGCSWSLGRTAPYNINSLK